MCNEEEGGSGWGGEKKTRDKTRGGNRCTTVKVQMGMYVTQGVGRWKEAEEKARCEGEDMRVGW